MAKKAYVSPEALVLSAINEGFCAADSTSVVDIENMIVGENADDTTGAF